MIGVLRNTEDAGLLAELRAALTAAGFTSERLSADLHAERLSSRGPDLAVNLRRLQRSEEPFATLVRLFILTQSVRAGDAETALAPVSPAALEEAGILVTDGDSTRSAIKLVPHGDLLIASDPDMTQGADDRNWVAGIHPPSVTLAKLAVRRPVQRALDVGTGNGVQALLAAQHSAEVVATDINPRALQYAEFNARLNGIENVTFREGSFFEPVAGEQFDLIVSNPPYVISPESLYAYRDSGLPGDQVSRDVVQAAADHLTDGGFATILISWGRRDGEEWSDNVVEWLEGKGCNVWLLHFGSDDQVTHVSGWLKPLAASDPEHYEETLDRWLAYLEEQQMDVVSYGAVLLQKTDRQPWVRADEIMLERQGAGLHIERVFSSQDLLATDGVEGLLDRHLTLVPEHDLTQGLRVGADGLELRGTELALRHGLGFSVSLDDETLHLLPLLDGSRTLGQALDARSAELGIEGEDAGRYVQAGLPAVRRLLELGFLDVR